MKNVLLLLALAGTAGALSAPIARADVSWEHRGSIKIGKKPIAFFSIKNDWSGQKHRTSLLFDASKTAKEMGMDMMMGGQKARAELNVVERLDDDRLIISTPMVKTYVDEPYKSLKSRLRLNFWEALGSDLSATDVPELTPAQRARLGQELRAVTSPFLKKVSRTYFRALPEQKTIGGMNSTGYRLSSMINVAPEKKDGEWIRFTAEWWLADEQGTDEEVRTFTQSAQDIIKAGGGPSASMWLNEQMPVLWEAMPVEAHQALASLIGTEGSPKFGFQGTPMRMYLTVTPPPAAAMGMGGDFRIVMDLAKRSTTTVDSTLFDPPTGGDRIEVEPFLGMAKNAMKMAKGELEKQMDF